MQPSQEPGFRKQTVDSWQVFGGVAGVLSLLGSLVAGLSDQKTVLLVAGGLLVLVGVALLYRWGRGMGGTGLGGFAIAVLVTVLGAATGGAAITAKTTGGQTAAAGTATSTTTTPATPTTGDTSSAPATSQTDGLPRSVGGGLSELYAKDVRLTYGTGVDLDRGDTRGFDVNGPNGEIDLFMNELNNVATAAIRANGDELYADQGPEKDALALCTATLKAQKDTSLFYGSAGTQYYFATSEGNVAWMRVNDIVEAKSATDYVVLNVKVWGTPPA